MIDPQFKVLDTKIGNTSRYSVYFRLNHKMKWGHMGYADTLEEVEKMFRNNWRINDALELDDSQTKATVVGRVYSMTDRRSDSDENEPRVSYPGAEFDR